ncbi:MAG: type IV toxin-antitoxin system AbiEi family antitoxin domain-containing protein [Nitrososphaera sp.]
MYKRKAINQYRHTLSDRESRILSSLSYGGSTIFTTRDMRGLVAKPKNILDNLVRKRWILKLRRGVYVIVPLEAGEKGAEDYTIHGFVIASFLVNPYYIGYWSALNYHGFTEQTPSSVYVATTKPKNSRTILNTRFVFVTIPKDKVFGLQEEEVEKWNVKISSPEKTVVDCLDHPEHCGGTEEVAKAIYFSRDQLDFKKVISFAKRIGNNTVIKRLGFIAETLAIEDCSKLLSNVTLKSGYSLLDPTLPRKGRIKEKWKLIINAPIEVKRWTV